MSELRTRVEAKKKQLQADLLETKADAQGKAVETRRRIEAKLTELEKLVEQGWSDLSDRARTRINEWLK